MRKSMFAPFALAGVFGTIVFGSGLAEAAPTVIAEDGIYTVGVDIAPDTYSSDGN
ncbi:hypothetical protein [Nocardia australiensis]|uniref:hypothetical protein n=1 Tax=Nocardia australiensis TaxID=2887191 RepID=UPI001D14DB9F|nr:hypothetical protein [Nocardia australiensis]